MKTYDLKKQFKAYYTASGKQPVMVQLPALQFLMLDGQGDPNEKAFQAGVETLYSIAYTLKFMLKKAELADYPVMPLEGLWWMDDMRAWSLEKRHLWKWTIMIMQPECVNPDNFHEGAQLAAKKKPLPLLPKLRLEKYAEGSCAQILHVGPYADEGPAIRRLHEFIHAQGLDLRGKHHEIYLGDPRRSAPEKLKTILRQGAGQ
ncbi:MAG: hypothetical protein HGA76_05340 [Candidatus Firestonebacteria bacterium]|nr:hypothetical protein [Candidatus Firestonebacteria bacterium]